jgi:hypothetical protein
MAIHLKACPSCARHARISESRCPFCGSPLPGSFRTPPPVGQPARRLTRAALISLGAAAGAIGLLEACSSDDQAGQPGQDAGPDVVADAGPGVIVSFGDAYGIAFSPDTGADQSVPPEPADTGARDQHAPDVAISFADAYGVAFFDVALHEAAPDPADAEAGATEAGEADATTDATPDATEDGSDTTGEASDADGAID